MNSIILRFIRPNIHIMLAKMYKIFKAFSFPLVVREGFFLFFSRHLYKTVVSLWHDYRYKGKKKKKK